MDREREMEPISISIDSIPAFVNGGPVFPIDSVPTFNGGPVHPIDSITTFINGGSVHHHLDQPEHTISQSLLILCCLTAVSSLHYEIGDTRSLEDFLQREEDAWWPRVGTEDYNGLQDAQTEQIISWEGCTAAFESTFAQHDGPTFHELRSQLRHILEEIGQLATWPPQPAFAGLRQLTSKHFDWKMSLWLVLFSCATTPATSRLSAEFWNTQQHDLQQLAMFLNTSPLFRTPLTVNDLKDWIEKLELVFCGPRREK
ncbi:hypothetical protein A1O3_06112 [Capronia epimyces CBS 606.96]|uniref:Uncharacterized protein n=1 Tax=Capronia epimyces CBS 606.96 TaxID=1182542 RepID=W9YJ33_9EURO|nr:uncharacterized protein A1O3_06112 [Capronia epimyces CBS 606.96]EXJ82299.1 hypothetical protein A1O3_06112 [Capronia epimyces CBS 606.96]